MVRREAAGLEEEESHLQNSDRAGSEPLHREWQGRGKEWNKSP